MDEVRRWRRRSNGHQGALPDQLYSGDVEDGVDAHGSQELEPHGRRVDDPLDGERADEPGSQFL